MLMEISLGIIAHNEEKNIEKLLISLINQKIDKVRIKEIIVVSSGSKDKTNEIVGRISKENKLIRLITENERKGKFSAINLFLKNAKSEILVLESADTIPKYDCVERLCIPLLNEKIGICASCPVPVNKKNNFMGFTVHLLWSLHHEISLENVKFGEMIAFRNIIEKIPNTAVDEEYIAMGIKNKGFKDHYAKDAIVYNKGPTNIKDFIKQRRRIYAGHLELKNCKDYKTITMNWVFVVKKLFKILEFRPLFLFWALGAIILEAYSRILGIYDFYIRKEKHYVWDVAESTK
jgi:cellulose synthase/poly-beta-1,6-N-acetylglucosamine synthase-like glycosyltransferase